MANVNGPSALRNIARYANNTRQAQEQRMESEAGDRELRDFQTRLDTTITQLQDQINRHRAELEKITQAAGSSVPLAPASDPGKRLKQLRSIKYAYEQITPSSPKLLGPDSVIPAILAADTVQQTIITTKDSISSVQSQQQYISKQLNQENAHVSDTRLLNSIIHARIDRMRSLHQARRQRSPVDLAKEQIDMKEKRRDEFTSNARKLRDELDDFVNYHLAAMLAAEELGGPVVGELLDVDEDLLEAGFSQQGRPLKVTKPKPSSVSTDRRQRRIDDIWGVGSLGSDDEPRTEKDAATEEFWDLLEQLLTALAGEGDTGVYVQLDRDSAVARFLVRVKVATFHPKDARRLRLVDFGRELDE